MDMVEGKQILFLHYGPGGNAEVESEWFSDSFKNVMFWNQPLLKSGGYKDLLSECTAQTKKIVAKTKKPLSLWGHSFGCNLVLDIAKELNSEISELILCAPLLNIPDGFFNLAHISLNDSDTPPHIKQNLINLLNSAPQEEKERSSYFWNLIGAITEDPHFPRLYWKNKTKYSKYLQIASNKPGFDFTMWQRILNDYVSNFEITNEINKIKNVIKIYIGEHDPYLKTHSEKERLKTLLPSSDVRVVKGVGHFCHLEWDDFSI